MVSNTEALMDEVRKHVFVRNKYGVQVKRCCAACMFKKLTRTTMRWCRLRERKVAHDDVCEWWKMNKVLERLKLEN